MFSDLTLIFFFFFFFWTGPCGMQDLISLTRD